MTIKDLDHLVLTVKSIDATCRFYVDVLGMTRETFQGDRTALKFGTRKINLHELGNEFEPRALHPTPGSGDLCFLVDDLDETASALAAHDVALIEGPVERTGARGKLRSLYVRDPDNNLIEVSVYTDPIT